MDKANTGTAAPSGMEPGLGGMFGRVASRYDLMNHLLTAGLDGYWRKKAARIAAGFNPGLVLEIGCGTGDFALLMARDFKNPAAVIGLDYSAPMLLEARRKADNYDLGDRVLFIRGQIAALPFRNGQFEVVGVSFAFRNITYRNSLTSVFLSEIKRVLGDGGKFVVLESSQPRFIITRFLFRLYLRIVVDFLGGAISGDRKAYHYLASSARYFYKSEQVSDLLKSAGFKEISHRPLFLGAVAIHVAVS